MTSRIAASPVLKRKNFTPASRETKTSVNAMPTPRCARKRKRTVERDIVVGWVRSLGLDGWENRERFPDPAYLPYPAYLACRRLLISAQLTTFHQASM